MSNHDDDHRRAFCLSFYSIWTSPAAIFRNKNKFGSLKKMDDTCIVVHPQVKVRSSDPAFRQWIQGRTVYAGDTEGDNC